MLWEKIANIKYTETQSHQLMLLFPPLWMSSIEVTVEGSYYLYKHLTSIKKRREKDSSHSHSHNATEHLRKMTRRGQHSTPKHKLSGQGEGEKNQKKRRLWQFLVWSSVYGGFVVVMQDRPAPKTFLLDNNQVVWKVKGWGSVRTEHRLSRKAGPGLDVWL